MAKQTVADLKKAIKDCKSDKNCIADCRGSVRHDRWGNQGSPGRRQGVHRFKGGKVFITTGGKVFG